MHIDVYQISFFSRRLRRRIKEDPPMSDEANNQKSMDPTELWKQWYETSTKAWSNALDQGKETHVDPYGLYQSWLKSAGEIQEQVKTSPSGMIDPKEAWQQWFDTTTGIWRKTAEVGGDPLGFTTQWIDMMEDARARMQAEGSFPADPFTFFKQWYDATSEMWSKVVGDIIGTEKFAEAAGHFLESYTSFYRTFRRSSEEYFRNLQLPTRSDLARVAELVVNLEVKVDSVEDAFEDFKEGQQGAIREIGTVLDGHLDQVENKLEVLPVALERIEELKGLSMRLDQVESKLDRVLSALEKLEGKKRSEPARSTSTSRPKTRKQAS
jgi:polyhydroxyalkanoic acid synthase PhaR subunit